MKVEDFMLRRLLFASLAGLALVVASPSVPVRALTIGIDIDACDITTVPFESSLQLDLLGFPNSPDGSSIDNRYIFTQMEHVEATGDGSLEFVLDVTLDRELEGDVAEGSTISLLDEDGGTLLVLSGGINGVRLD